MLYRQFENLTVYDMLALMAQKYGDQPALSYRENDTEQTKSYHDFFYECRLAAQWLNDKNLFGKYIVIDSRNTYCQLVCIMASMMMGAVAVFVNFDLAEEDVLYVLDKIKPSAVFYDAQDADFPFPNDEELICMCDSVIGEVISHETRLFEKNLQIMPNDPAAVLLTSGSTSRSKFVLLSHHSMLPLSDYHAERSILTFPLYHIAGIKVLINDLSRGAHICLSDFRRGMEDIAWFRPKQAIAIPMFVSALVKRSKLGILDIGCFESIHTGGAPQNEEVVRYLNALGIASYSVYGATESGGIITKSYPNDNKIGTVGKPGPWNPVEISPEGEILISGKCVMLCYLGDEQATKQAFVNGKYRTGDLGAFDEDGYLHITGRIKNIIILSNGENVSPEAIETKLSVCADIEEIVVYENNDTICAEIYTESLTAEKELGIRTFIKNYNKTVPSYHRVKTVTFRSTPFEKTQSNKIKRQIQKEQKYG